MITNCEFSEPVYWSIPDQALLPLTNGFVSGRNWNFLKQNCSSTDVYTLIENKDTGASFYVEKTLNYGEAMILWFLTMFSFYLIFKSAYHFFWKK